MSKRAKQNEIAGPKSTSHFSEVRFGIWNFLFLWSLALGFWSFPFVAFAETRSLLLISIDGLRPDYATKADEHGLRIPNLRRFMKEGAYATGVRGVLPTSTYPSHTTILTGVSPAKHGIDENHPFDPKFANPGAWYWFTENIRVPTLWTAASRAGIVVGSISWPVSVGAEDIHFNIPEYNGTRTPEDLKMTRALASTKLMSELGKNAGPYATDVKDAIPRDWIRTRYAVEMIRQKEIRFLTVHLASSDHLQHENGPFTAPVFSAIEEIDKMVEAMSEAMRKKDAKAVICIVSDHGFTRVENQFKLGLAFVKEGLVTLKSEGDTIEKAGVKDWIALPSSAGGSACIMMKNPQDETSRAKVKTVLEKLASDSANGIAEILDRAAIAKLGGTAEAVFWVDMKPGFSVSSSLKEPLASKVTPRGTHGYSPTHPEMNASFFIVGKEIRKGVDLGVIDMRSIAPTLSKIMNLSLPTADLPALDVLE